MNICIIPRRLIGTVTSSVEEGRILNLFASNVLLLLAFATLPIWADLAKSIPHTCLFESAFGIPCPGCGFTRSLLFLSVLDLKNSMEINPAGLVFLLASTTQIFLSIAACFGKLNTSAHFHSSRFVASVFVGVLLINWTVVLIN